MKKLLSLMLLLLAAMMTTATFTACGDDDDDNDNATQTISGTYTGKDTLAFSVMGMTLKQNNTADVDYVVNQNNDGTISVVIPEETFDFTAQKMGNIVQGTYSVNNIPYDKTKKLITSTTAVRPTPTSSSMAAKRTTQSPRGRLR